MRCRLDCSTTSVQAPTIFNTSKLHAALFKCTLRQSGITVLSHRIQTDPPIRGVRIREGCAAASTAPPQVHKLQQSSSKLHAALSKSILRQSGITFLSHRIQTDPPIRRCKKLGCHPRRMCCRLDCSTTSAQAPTIFKQTACRPV